MVTSALVSAFAVVSVRAQPASQPPQILRSPSSATAVPTRFYRARRLDFAPAGRNGKTIVATVTNAGPFTVTLVYGFDTFTQTNGGDTQEGRYVYTRSGPVTAWLRDVITSPPDLAGETSTAQFLFSTPTQGIFVSNSLEPGEPVDTVSGTFEMLPDP